MQPKQNNENGTELVQPKPVATDAPIHQLPVEEIGGIEGPEPTRYGDWEKNGRCVDF